MKYFRLWLRIALMSFAVQSSSPVSSFGYLLGKLARVAFFLVFLVAIFHHTSALAGYTLEQAALFFLTFNLVDMLAQLFFRGIYGIRSIVREGDFDYYLIQPTNVLYRVAFSSVDFLDVATVAPIIVITVGVLRRIPGGITLPHVLLYLLLLGNGLVIAFAIHICVAALAVLTQEMDNTIWIYRDLMTLGRFPSDIYDRPMRALLTFVMPIAVMVSFPAKAFLGRLPTMWILQAVVMAMLSLALSLWFWRFATRRYTSTSS